MKRKLPTISIPAIQAREPRILPGAADRWAPGVQALASGDAAATIDIFDPIGPDYFGEGVTAKRVSSQLRAAGSGDVVVNINSPGGFFDEGLTIYNLLRMHAGHVTTRVLGIAASAASVIAMAGDTVQMARAGFLMIHNGWVMAAGDRHFLRETADYLEPFDLAMAGIYAARTGMAEGEAGALMDKETWLGGAAAIADGFADELLPSDQEAERTSDEKAKARAAKLRIAAHLQAQGLPSASARRLVTAMVNGGNSARDEIGALLKEAGMSRAARRALLDEAGMPRAADDGPAKAPLDALASLEQRLRDYSRGLS